METLARILTSPRTPKLPLESLLIDSNTKKKMYVISSLVYVKAQQ